MQQVSLPLECPNSRHIRGALPVGVKTRNGYQAREAKGLDPRWIATDPRFQRTRENGAEFGRAIQAGKLFRRVVRPVILMDADAKKPNRLSSSYPESLHHKEQRYLG